MRLLEAREELRGEVAALVGVSARQVALTASTTDGCNIVLAGLDLRRRRRGDHDDRRALRPHRSAAHVRREGRRRRARSRADRRRGDAAHTAHRALARPLDDRRGAARARAPRPRPACRSSSTERSRSARCPSTRQGSTSTPISGQKWLCGPEGTGALVVADPDALRVGRPSYLVAAGLRAGRDVRAEGGCGAVRSEPDAERASVAGLRAAIAAIPDVGVRASGRDGGALPRAPDRGGLRRRRAGGARDARLLARAGRRVGRRSSRGSPRPASSCATSPGGGSSARRSAGGTTTSDLERLVAGL